MVDIDKVFQSECWLKVKLYLVTAGVWRHRAPMCLPLSLRCLLLFLVVGCFPVSSSHRLMGLFNFSGICIIWTEVCQKIKKKTDRRISQTGWIRTTFQKMSTVGRLPEKLWHGQTSLSNWIHWSCISVTIQTVKSSNFFFYDNKTKGRGEMFYRVTFFCASSEW